MPSVVSVLLVEADEPLARNRAEWRLVTGWQRCVTGSRRLAANPMARGRQRTAGHDDRCVREMSCDRLADWSSATTGYRSAYRSSYTHVYNQQKEVSQ
jgi:hypothetical protein